MNDRVRRFESGLAPWAIVGVAAVLPYLITVNDYFVRDDFGVVQLLAQKPFSYFPRWFASSWMDDIWAYVPDEVRPFPALSYQLTALGGPVSPTLHHALNILIHAGNGLLVMAIGLSAARLGVMAAMFAGLMFVLMPVHAESVAWITGRVDSMPAFFYLAAFLAYVRFRHQPSRWLYICSLVLFFIALFTKQNTITMVATLAAYDVIVLGRPIWPPLAFVRPYLPFGVMTAAYLWLRYILFGQVAREGALNARGLEEFRFLLDRHFRHVVAGDFTAPAIVAWLAVAAVVAVWLWTRGRARVRETTTRGLAPSPVEGPAPSLVEGPAPSLVEGPAPSLVEGPAPSLVEGPASSAFEGYGRRLLYFGPAWWAIGVLPIAVAGYHSPRHVYLAAVGWAIVVPIALEAASKVGHTRYWRRAVAGAAALVLLLYLVPLYRAVQEWRTMAAVSQKVTRDVRDAALSSTPGGLVIVGAPRRSWEWALPFAARPPYQRTDLYDRVFIISPRALSCCTGPWLEETRRAIAAWSAGAGRDSVVALRWDADTGALVRANNVDTPELPALIRSLLDMPRPDDVDRTLNRILDVLPVSRR